MNQDAGGGLSYFSKHQKIHPRIVHGRFSRLRVVALFLTLGVLYVLFNNFQQLADEGVIDDEDIKLVNYAETPAEAWSIIAKFHGL